MASIADAIGRDRVETYALAKGYQDPHFVDAKPSFILKLSRADVLIVAGLELEIGYLPPLIDQSRNDKIHPGSAGYLDASIGCDILQRPTEQVTRAMGDVHPLGNPHYWLDPDNGKRIGKAIADKFSQLRPNDRHNRFLQWVPSLALPPRALPRSILGSAQAFEVERRVLFHQPVQATTADAQCH